MRWYVSRNGESSGPHEESLVRQWALAGELGPDAVLRDEAASAWVPLAQTPFGVRVAPAAFGSGSEAIGTIMLLLPFSAAVLIIFWVGEMNIFQKPGDTLALLVFGTVIGTAILGAVEASSLGMGT